MDDQIIVIGADKSAKSGKMYGCPHCSYKANRTYNVQRHLSKHFAKPPKELQHICPFVPCSFTTVRWDNMSRHIQRLHQESKPKSEEREADIIFENIMVDSMDEEQCSFEATCSHNVKRHVEKPTREALRTCPYDGCSFTTLRWDNLKYHIQKLHPERKPRTADKSSDEDSTYVPSDEELTRLIDEIPIDLPTEDPYERTPVQNQPIPVKLSRNVKPKDKKMLKPRTNYKSGKTKYYQCSTCDYRTTRNYNIKRHIAKHITKQGTSTSSGSELLLHVCVIAGCGFSTPRWDNLCRHVKRVHPDDFITSSSKR